MEHDYHYIPPDEIKWKIDNAGSPVDREYNIDQEVYYQDITRWTPFEVIKTPDGIGVQIPQSPPINMPVEKGLGSESHSLSYGNP